MNGIRMKSNIVKVEPCCTQVLITKDSLLTSPLEASHHGVLDLVKVLHPLSAVDHEVGAVGVRTKAPNLPGLRDVILVSIRQVAASDLGFTFPSSISSARPSGMGTAFMNNLLCLLGDLDRHIMYDSSGSDFLRGICAWSSSRSFRQISRWSSPAPAIICSPDSSMRICTMGSDLDSLFNPSTSLGRSAGFLGSTATLTTGETENFMTFMLCASLKVVMVPVLTKNWSTPTRPQMFPAGTSSMASTLPPIMRMVLWMDFSYKSSFFPGTKLGPMIRAFIPVAILPEKTRPKA